MRLRRLEATEKFNYDARFRLASLSQPLACPPTLVQRPRQLKRLRPAEVRGERKKEKKKFRPGYILHGHLGNLG